MITKIWADFNKAMHSDNVAQVEILYKQFSAAELKIYLKNNWIPLTLAVSGNNLKVAKFFLDSGEDVNNVILPHRFTVLITASLRGYVQMTQLLLAYKPQLEKKDLKGYTALHYAVLFGHKEIVELLISKGANIHSQSILGRPIMADAIDQGCLEIAKILYEYGAKLDYLTRKGLNFLDTALLNEDKAMVEWLSAKGLKTQFNSLQLAIFEGDIQKAKESLKNPKEVDDGFFMSPLFLAVQTKHLELIKWLLDNGADSDKKIDRISPLELAHELMLLNKFSKGKLSVAADEDKAEADLIAQIISMLENKRD